MYIFFSFSLSKIKYHLIYLSSVSRLKRADHQLLWDHQLHCRKDHPSSLPKVLASVPSWDWASIAHIHSLLHHWPPLPPVTALEMLDSKYVDVCLNFSGETKDEFEMRGKMLVFCFCSVDLCCLKLPNAHVCIVCV